MRTTLPALALLAAGLMATAPTRAAESYANCTGFIDSVPAVVATQGVWCLRGDLSTAINIGSAISVQANNVTIDCNHFKLGGLAAGDTSAANGIHASSRANVTIRNCTIRGFNAGVALWDSGIAGALVEDNRFDGNLSFGILVQGDGSSMVRRNRVIDTGGRADPALAVGIQAAAHVLDNTVEGVFTLANEAPATGIYVPSYALGRVVRGNRVRAVSAHGDGYLIAIRADGARSHVVGNHAALGGPATGIGILNNGSPAGFDRDNTVSGFGLPYFGTATDGGGNVSN